MIFNSNYIISRHYYYRAVLARLAEIPESDVDSFVDEYYREIIQPERQQAIDEFVEDNEDLTI